MHVGWILNGRAVQDVFVSYKGEPPQAVTAGTTVRFYDPKLDAWHCVWVSPLQNVMRTFIARKVADEIVLEGETQQGLPEHWIFSGITPTAFRWRAVESPDKGKTWRLTEEMHVRRIIPEIEET